MAPFLQNNLKIMVKIYFQVYLKQNKTSKANNQKILAYRIAHLGYLNDQCGPGERK